MLTWMLLAMMSLLPGPSLRAVPVYNPLLNRVALDRALEPYQEATLKRVVDSPAVTNWNIVYFNWATFQNDTSARVILPGADTLYMRDYKVEKEERWRYSMNWRSRDGDTTVFLTVTYADEEWFASGMIYRGVDVYALEPLGGGLHVIYKIDQTKYPRR